MSQEIELNNIQPSKFVSENDLDRVSEPQAPNKQNCFQKLKNNHLYLLLLKNYLVYTRQLSMTILLFLSPIIICLMILLWQAIINNFSNFLVLNPAIKPLIRFDYQQLFKIHNSQIPLCQSKSGENCTSIGYFILGQEEEWITNTMKRVAVSESLEFGQDVKLLGRYQSPSSISEYLLAHMNLTQIAVVFCTSKWELTSGLSIPCEFDRLQPKKLIFYTILYNYTLLYVTPYLSDQKAAYPKDSIATRLKVSLDNSILREFSTVPDIQDEYPHMDVYTQDYPSIPSRFIDGIDVAGDYGAFYFFAPYLLGFLLTVQELLTEKGRRLRQGLVVVGLSHQTYWLSWGITAAIKVFLLTIILILTGLALSFDLFWKTPIPITFTLFFTFGFGIQLLAFFISTVCPDVKNGYTIAYGFILTAIVMQMFFTNFLLTKLFYRSNVSNFVHVMRFMFALYPAFKYSMIFGDIAAKACKHYDLTENRWVDGTGFGYSDLFASTNGSMTGGAGHDEYYNSPSPIENYIELCLSCLFYMMLTYYFDHVLASNRGRSESSLFCIATPIHRCIGLFRGYFYRQENVQVQNINLNEDDQQLGVNRQELTTEEERKRVIYNYQQRSELNGLRIVGLSKTYNRYPYGIQSIEDVHALKQIYLEMESGELLALLGHNGAGKTTLIGVLTGMLEPTLGTAQILNYDIKESMTEVRKIMGVCPQFDILWDQLTAAEHLRMYAAVKEVPWYLIEEEVDNRLREVDLMHVKNAQIGTFSGGMKRRVSLAISAVGDPRVIILDEPTTGMDPKARRQVWQVIKNMKANRVVLLTTHAMEEADALADRIAVMADGDLKCVGSSLYLKNNFSDGYRLNVVCAPENINRTLSLLTQLVQEAKLQDKSGGSLVFSVPLNKMSTLKVFFELVENEKSINSIELSGDEINELRGLIKEWGLSHATLEEVFMKVTKKV